MNVPKWFTGLAQTGKGKIAVQGGSYSLAMTALVLALVIVLNLLVSVLPSGWTKFDISASQLYSITSNTKVVVGALDQDVTIYWIVQADQEDGILENLLEKYESLSDHIIVEKRNPDVYPTFAQQYTDETVENNSLVVECGDRYRFIGNDDIYLYESSLYSYGYPSPSAFDGEGAITSAIDYVVNEDQPVVYRLEGHGEADLPETFSQQLEKENIQLESLSLLNVDQIPEDGDCLLLYGPTSDLSQEETQMLEDYVAQGGKLLVLAGPVEDQTMDNLNAFLEDYGVTAQEGIVVEGDREHYAFQTPLLLLPDLGESEITSPLVEEHYYPVLPIAQGLTVGTVPEGVTVTELLTTSEEAFSKLDGYDMTDFQREEGDLDGPFALGVSLTVENGGEIIWISSSDFLEDTYNAYSSGANVNLTINALSELIGESEAMAIRSKSLDYNYLTISQSTASLLQGVMIGLLPLAYLGIGIWVVVKRRRETA